MAKRVISTTVRDSEDKLGLTPEDVNKLLADTNTTVAKTKGFTQIGDANYGDGLIFTSLIKLLDAGNDGEEMAGISGIAGDNKEDPAFWAGGTYEQAIGGTAKAIIRHDGSSKFTDTEITGTVNATSGSFTGHVEADSGEIGDFAIVDGELTANHSYMTYLPGGAYVQVTSDIQLTSGGIIISNSYGGTMDHPQVVQWDTELTSAGVKVGIVEIKMDGIYIDGVKKL